MTANALRQIARLRPDIARRLKLGDKVERIAKPIARVIDKIANTNLEDCNSCKKRKDFLNGKIL